MDNTLSNVLLQSDTNELEIVEFRIDEVNASGETVPCYYGVNVAKVREIIRLPEVCRVVNSPPSVAGIIRLRDQVISLIDLADVLGKHTGDFVADRVIVLEFNRLMVGILVQSVSRIYRISWQAVEPPIKTVNAPQVTGLVKMDDRIIILLDYEKIVGELCSSHALLPIDEEVLASAAATRPEKKVLIADDSPFIRHTMRDALATAGYQITEAENGEDAWNIISANNEFDLVITDVEMPKMDGLHLTSRIKKTEQFKGVPVVIFSSLASDDNIAKWKSLGAEAILTKPDLPHLVGIVDQLVGIQ